MGIKLYTIINNSGFKIGSVNLDVKHNLYIKLYDLNIKIVDNIYEVFNIIEGNNYMLIDIDGDLYTRSIHNSYLTIDKFNYNEKFKKYGVSIALSWLQ